MAMVIIATNTGCNFDSTSMAVAIGSGDETFEVERYESRKKIRKLVVVVIKFNVNYQIVGKQLIL